MKKLYLLKAFLLSCLLGFVGTSAMAQTTTVTDELTAADLAAASTSYTAFSDVTITSDAVYAGRSAKSGSTIQLNSSSPNGIVTTKSGEQ